MVTPGDIFDGYDWRDATGFWWVEAMDATKNPAMHRIAPTTKNHATQNVSSAEEEESLKGVKPGDFAVRFVSKRSLCFSVD